MRSCSRASKTPICLDESIHTVRIARDAIEARRCRIINIKPGRVGGHQASIELHDLCAAHGIPVWYGGMLESGIGRAHNITWPPCRTSRCRATSPPANATTSPT